MNQVFCDYLDDFVVVYLDDVVVFSRSLKDHVVHLKWVLSRLREHQLYLNLEKCRFTQENIEFLGRVIGKGEVPMDWTKVAPILD